MDECLQKAKMIDNLCLGPRENIIEGNTEIKLAGTKRMDHQRLPGPDPRESPARARDGAHSTAAGTKLSALMMHR